MVNFKQLLEKATNGDSAEPDWETILEIVEEVKSKNISAKNAAKDFRKRLLDNGGNIVYHTLLVLDSLMKNCASDVHSEVLSVEFLGVVKAVITSSKDGKSEKAIDKGLELIGEWKMAFGEQSGYKAINTIFSELEREGYHIPMAQVASAAFIKKAPEWVLGDRCFLCRQDFNRFKGKLRHHCRNCGKSVCAQCSGKRAPLPHFGVEESTRVCDVCYKKVDKGEGASAAAAAAADVSSGLPEEYLRSSLAQETQTPSTATPSGGGGTEQLQEDDDMQLAIAMSLNEQDNKTKKSSPAPVVKHVPHPAMASQFATPSAPPPVASTLYASIIHDQPAEPAPSYSHRSTVPQSQPVPEPSSDPLARYLDRNYWEQRKEQQSSGISPQSTAPQSDVGPEAVAVVPQIAAGPTGSPLAESIRNTISMFVKRLHEMNSNGESIATDPVVLSLYQNLTAMQPQLLKQIDEIQQEKAKQLEVINKLNEAKEARVTLNKMRRDHQDKVKQMEQEQSMLARMQMEQKLALLRQQKQEQLVFQQSLQNKRLEVLNSQRLEYQQKVAMQREVERQQLIAQEQKVLQHQFGGGGGGGQHYQGSSPQPVRKMEPAGPPPPVAMSQQQFSMHADVVQPSSVNFDSTSMSLQSMSLHDPNQAAPLPSKLEYNPGIDPSIAPPPYNPSATTALGQGQGVLPQHDPPPPPPPPSASMYTSYQHQLPASQQTSAISLQSGYSGQGGFEPTPTQLTSMQPTSGLQPSSHQSFNDFDPVGAGQPHNMQHTNMGAGQPQPPNMGQLPNMGAGQSPNMGQPPNMGAGQPPNMGPNFGPNLGAGQQMSIYGSSPAQLSQPQPGPVNGYTPLAMGQQQHYQQQDPPPSTQPPPQSYGAGYQGYQTQYPQQQQQAPGSFVPNEAAGIQRQESEPSLISFD